MTTLHSVLGGWPSWRSKKSLNRLDDGIGILKFGISLCSIRISGILRIVNHLDLSSGEWTRTGAVMYEKLFPDIFAPFFSEAGPCRS
jgi:hypothetical protein